MESRGESRQTIFLPREAAAKRAVRLLAAGAMVAIGIAHVASPDGFVKIVPHALPAPVALVYISGYCEMLGGMALLVPRVHKFAAYGLIALFVAVFPANINMALNDIQPAAHHLPEWALWLRLPFQFLFMYVAWWLSRTPA